MLKNYLSVAIRHLRKSKIFTGINILGLTIGIAACLLIMQYVSFELSYDQFHKNGRDIYRVYNDRYQNGKLIQHGTITYSGVGRAMNDDFEEVIANVRVEPLGDQVLINNEKKISEPYTLAVDPNFFTVFSFPLLAGDAANALREPRAIVISETLARTMFDFRGNDFRQLLERSLVMGRDSAPYKITGILKNVPENSHLRFELLLSYSTLYKSYGWEAADYGFTDSDFWHYVQLKPGTDPKSVEAKLPAFSQRHFQGNKISGTDEKFFLQPLSRAHLYSDFEYEIGQTGSASVVWGLLLIAVFIIVIAWVNYINLATARSMERAKEVGIRKVVGGVKKQLISQFMVESILANLVALVLALGAVWLLQPAFNRLLQHDLNLSYLLTKGMGGYSISVGLLLLLLVGVLASGFYPAFVLSSFKPILVLKGKFSTSRRGILLRKGLVTAQFAITVALLIGSIVVYKQIRFMSKAALGFNMDQLIVIRPPLLSGFDSSFIARTIQFKEAIKGVASVQDATTSWNVPGGDVGRSFNVHRADSGSATRNTMRHTGIDYDFINVYGIKLLAGRNFSAGDYNVDFDKVNNMLINRSAAALLGFSSPSDAIGRSIMRGQQKFDVVGVVEDYHQKSLRYALEPMIFMPAYSTNSDITVKIKPTDIANTVASIKQQYESFFPGNLFDYVFLDEKFNSQYRDEQLFGKAFSIFAGFAIFIACMGLFGLSLFSTMQRTKEIGVRKVLGASVPNILLLLSGDFVRLVLIANVIAIPVAWWIMHNWLQDFAYRINLSWWIFVTAAAIALFIAMATITGQAMRSAMASPAKSLRTE